MAMKKADLETHAEEYHAQMAEAQSALKDGLWREAIELAVSSWKYVDGMMQYERRYESREFTSVEGIDIVLKYAPLLFDLQSLDELGTLLKSQRRIQKNMSRDLASELANAKQLVWDAHCMWNHLEQNTEARQDQLRQSLGGDQDRWRSVAQTWEQMGLVRRTSEGGSYRLSFSTQMNEEVRAKCPSCGVIAKAAKAKFLGQRTCPQCKATVLFVILSRQVDTVAGE